MYLVKCLPYIIAGERVVQTQERSE